MKILWINYEFPPLGGGASTANYYIFKELAKESGTSIHLITASVHQNEYTKFSKNISIEKINVGKGGKNQFFQKLKNIFLFFLLSTYKSFQYCKKGKVDMVVIFFALPSGITGLLLKIFFRVPYIVSLRGSDVPGFNKRFEHLYPFLRPMFNIVLKFSSGVFTNSSHLKKLAEKSTNKEILIIPNGVDFKIFKPSLKKSGRKEVRLVTVARLIPRKGVDYIIEVLKEIPKEIPWALTIVGDGSERNRLSKLARKYEILDRIAFKGHIARSHIQTYYQDADIFILASDNEGMSNSLLEAMATGLPVLTTNTGDAETLLKDKNQIIHNLKPKEFRRKLIAFLRNKELREKTGNNNLEIVKKYSWGRTAHDIILFLKRNTKKKFSWQKKVLHTILPFTHGDIMNNFSKVQQYAYLSEKKIKQLQEKKLKKLLLYSYKNVPYYKELLGKYDVVTSHDEVNLRNFKKLPILTKDIIRDKNNILVSSRHSLRGSFFNTSGGSTGEPVEYLQDKYYKNWNFANKLFYAHNLGKEIGDPEIKLWGSERDILEGTIGWKEKMQNLFFNRTFLNSFRMSHQNMESYIDQINHIKPVYIWSYVSSIGELSKYIQRKRISVWSPKIILVTAGVLTEKIRRLIQKSFNTDVFNQYGSREVGDIAVECREKKGLHVFEWTHYVEVINKKIVITLLTNFSMPLIRYEIGDTAEWARGYCPCGAHTKRLRKVLGRVTDHFILRDGTIIHGEYFTHLFYFKKWVKQFKVIQEKFDTITCYIVPLSKHKKSDEDKIKNDIKKVMGDDCVINIVFVDQINRSKSGKYLYTESKIHHEKI